MPYCYSVILLKFSTRSAAFHGRSSLSWRGLHPWKGAAPIVLYFAGTWRSGKKDFKKAKESEETKDVTVSFDSSDSFESFVSLHQLFQWHELRLFNSTIFKDFHRKCQTLHITIHIKGNIANKTRVFESIESLLHLFSIYRCSTLH